MTIQEEKLRDIYPLADPEDGYRELSSEDAKERLQKITEILDTPDTDYIPKGGK
jgi:hypothetical protein